MNIEQEMEMIFNSQNKNIIPNPFVTKYPDATIITSSTTNFLISFSELLQNDKHCYLRNIYVVPELRKLNVGTMIVEKLIEECIKKNIHSIEVESENNSMKFFEKLGFKLNGDPNNRMVLNF